MKAILLFATGLLIYTSGFSQNVGIGTPTPLQKLHVEGTTFLNGNVGIGNNSPTAPLSFNAFGVKIISLFHGASGEAGFGVFASELRIHSDYSNAAITFGYDDYNLGFTERMRIINSGGSGMVLKGRIELKNGTSPLDINYGPGIWLNKADNSALLSFMGTQNNQNVGFYGGPAGWGFTYDAVNSRVGIGVITPNAKLSVSVDGTELSGTASGSTLRTNAGSLGNTAGSEISLANIGYVSTNNSSLGIRAYRNSAGTDWTTTALLLGYDVDNVVRASSGFLALGANGNVGIGTTNPAAKLHVSAGDASRALFGPNAAGGSLYVGASGGDQGVALTAQVIVNNFGNLHINPAPGKNIQIGSYQPTDIYLNPNGGTVQIGTAILQASLEVYGYTRLGSDAPSIKFKKLIGTTASTEGSSVYIPHGLNGYKILSISVLVDYGFPPNLPLTGYNFFWYSSSGTDIEVRNVAGQSNQILSKPIRILITYEE